MALIIIVIIVVQYTLILYKILKKNECHRLFLYYQNSNCFAFFLSFNVNVAYKKHTSDVYIMVIIVTIISFDNLIFRNLYRIHEKKKYELYLARLKIMMKSNFLLELCYLLSKFTYLLM